MNKNLCTKKYGNESIGYVKDLAPNEEFREMVLLCPYEHCIETMPLTGGEAGCPVFGHDCPAGEPCHPDECNLERLCDDFQIVCSCCHQ